MNGLKVLRAQILSELESMKKLLDEAAGLSCTTFTPARKTSFMR